MRPRANQCDRVHLSGLFIHPVKSLRGCSVGSAEVDALGLVGDRRFMVVDAEGRFLTQRSLPRMALVETTLSATTLTLSAPGSGSCSVSRGAAFDSRRATVRSVSIWKSQGLQSDDCGDEAAAWLSEFLRVACRLVRIGERFSRPMLKIPSSLPPGSPHHVSFADAFPFLVISEASLADLSDRLVARGEDALPMDRFRPNFVVSGCAAFAEDSWTRFRIGDLVLHAAGPCARCVVTTTDQQTAERGKEPLRTLAAYRRDAMDPTDVNFGQNLIHETKSGIVRVGDPVEMLAAL